MHDIVTSVAVLWGHTQTGVLRVSYYRHDFVRRKLTVSSAGNGISWLGNKALWEAVL